MSKIILIICTVMLAVSIPAIVLLYQNQQKTVKEQAHIRAQAIYQMIIVTRQWVADNRDAVDPVPAVVTKELAKYANNMTAFKFHITSNKLVNPENATTIFEENALTKIEQENLFEYADIYIDKDKNRFYRYAAPLYINQSCLACHEDQDYTLDDVRGLISIEFSLAEMDNSIASSNKIIFYALIIGIIILTISISFFIYMFVIKHLTSLKKAADNMRLGKRIATNIKTGDELENLSQAFDQMSLQIINNEEVLKHNLNNAVSKYVDLVTELEHKNKKLDSINNLKSDLLDSISHEIRTPLTKILSYSELLNDERVMGQTDMREKFTLALKHNVNVLKNMFNDIITLSRLEHDQHTYHLIPVQIEYLLQDIIDNNEIDIISKNLNIINNIEPYKINVDGETFAIAISNIISNAIKYSKNDGTIEINGKKEDNNYLITFKDYGIGIMQEDISKLFERFYRGANAKKEYAGTGLGLSIVARIIKAHNGSINIESEINNWTKITVTIPLNEK